MRWSKLEEIQGAKYEAKTSILASNTFFDTDNSSLIVEYSKCKKFFRSINLVGYHSGWIQIKYNTSIRVSRCKQYYIYESLKIKFLKQ